MEDFSEIFEKNQFQLQPPNNFRLTSLPHKLEVFDSSHGDPTLAYWAIVPFIPSEQRSARVRVIFQELLVPLKYISYSAASLLELRWLLPGNGKLEHKVCPGGVKEFKNDLHFKRWASAIIIAGKS